MLMSRLKFLKNFLKLSLNPFNKNNKLNKRVIYFIVGNKYKNIELIFKQNLIYYKILK